MRYAFVVMVLLSLFVNIHTVSSRIIQPAFHSGKKSLPLSLLNCGSTKHICQRQLHKSRDLYRDRSQSSTVTQVHISGGDNRTDILSAAAVAATMTTAYSLNGVNASRCDELQFPEESLLHDHYSGVTVLVSSLPSNMTQNPEVFATILEQSLNEWSAEGKRGIWVKVPRESASLVPKIVDMGFDFQHAHRGQVTLTKWLPSESKSRLPFGPTHQIGVGALILHPNTKQMLVVKEKSGPAKARNLWKMPTGLTDPGEDIPDAALREVKEETGLDCVFDRILCFREAHSHSRATHSHSDMFFICLVRLANEDEIEDLVLKPQEEEIEQIQWMDIEDYCGQKTWAGSPAFQELNAALAHVAQESLESQSLSNQIEEPLQTRSGSRSYGFIGKKLPVGFRPGTNTVYVCKPQQD